MDEVGLSLPVMPMILAQMAYDLSEFGSWARSPAGVASGITLTIGLFLGVFLGYRMGQRSGFQQGRDVGRALGSKTESDDNGRPAPREIELETRIWNRPLTTRSPLRLRPVSERQTRIISFFNLKGGVGKTSLCANLAATLSRRGRKVLVLDLDHQQSLTGLCLTTAQVAETRRSEVAIHHLFDTENVRGDVLHQIAKKVRGAEATFEAVPSHHELAEMEDLIMLKWLRDGQRDVRFALTSALLNSRFKDWADYVLLDCPPRLTTASVNALAVSDFIVAPVLPDQVTMDAVQFLVKHLQQLGDLLPFPAFDARLGLVTNRAGGQFELTPNFWSNVSLHCPAEWRPQILGFNTVIRERVSFRDAAADGSENARRFAIDLQKETASQFSALADELETVLRAPSPLIV